VGKTSRFLGVSLDKVHNRWVANIMVGGNHTYLGSYREEENAARAYNRAAEKAGRTKLNPVSGEITETISHVRGRKTYIMTQFEKIKEMYRRGGTLSELGYIYNVPPYSIRYLLKSRGVL